MGFFFRRRVMKADLAIEIGSQKPRAVSGDAEFESNHLFIWRI
jgi:hypothetical protein